MRDTTAVSPPEGGKKTSSIIEDATSATMRLDQEHAQCHWNGESFARGGRVSVNDKTYECTFGCWVRVED